MLGHFQGPFYLGEKITLSDIVITPWLERMCVLKHYRGFEIPKSHKVFKKWYQWKKKRKGIEDKIPTIKHGDKVLRGEIDCIEYIDKTFGDLKDFYPPEYSTTMANLNLYC